MRSQEERGWIVVAPGLFDINDTEEDVFELGLELRSRPMKWGLAAAGGVAVTDEEAAWIWGGVRRDFPLGASRRTWIGLGFGVSLYDEGDGKDLGGPVEFRSSIELSFKVAASARLGLNLYHLSNAGLYDLNPGSNSLVLVAAFGL